MANQPAAGGAGDQPGHSVLERLVIPTVVAVVGALSASIVAFLFAHGSIGWAFGLCGFAALVLVVVGILAIERKRRTAIWDSVKRPVRTGLVILVATALGLGVGWLAWGNMPTVNPTGHIVEWVNGGGQPNTSWLVENNGKRYWIPNTSIFFCLVKEGHTDLGAQSSTVLDGLPDSGQWASCA